MLLMDCVISTHIEKSKFFFFFGQREVQVFMIVWLEKKNQRRKVRLKKEKGKRDDRSRSLTSPTDLDPFLCFRQWDDVKEAKLVRFLPPILSVEPAMRLQPPLLIICYAILSFLQPFLLLVLAQTNPSVTPINWDLYHSRLIPLFIF